MSKNKWKDPQQGIFALPESWYEFESKVIAQQPTVTETFHFQTLSRKVEKWAMQKNQTSTLKIAAYKQEKLSGGGITSPPPPRAGEDEGNTKSLWYKNGKNSKVVLNCQWHLIHICVFQNRNFIFTTAPSYSISQRDLPQRRGVFRSLIFFGMRTSISWVDSLKPQATPGRKQCVKQHIHASW